MFKKPRFTLAAIILFTLAAIYIDLPQLTLGENLKFVHPQPLKNFIRRDLEPKLGLDLAGGVQLVMSADMTNIRQEDRNDAHESVKNVVENRVNALGVAEPVIQTTKTRDQHRLIVELAGIPDIDQAIALVKKTAHLEFKTLKSNAPPEATFAPFPDFYQGTGLTGTQLKRALAQPSQDPQNPGYVVALEFNDEGAKKFEEITRNNLGRPVAISLDEQIITSPTVQAVISDGNAIITGNFTSQEARQLSIQLNAGALPVPLIIESQTRVGPTLGADSIQKGIFASAVGITSVMIFMTLYYRILGIFAVAALLIYTTLVFAIFKLIPVTLTLAGIAGFVLSIGMAVDANILIFERIKEEIRWGKPKLEALFAGFERAWPSIRDSNVSSLLTTAILFNFGTGPIRGFALTLAIGILVSMFSAITVTRTLIRVFWVRKI
ncbi:MAG: protein translocase subunit SecD [Patescibacteria group bacterium]